MTGSRSQFPGSVARSRRNQGKKSTNSFPLLITGDGERKREREEGRGRVLAVRVCGKL